MSDFLTQLAERALGLGPRVEPKLPRRFAALVPAESSAAGEWRRQIEVYRRERDGATADPRSPADE